jgi:thiol peroxidase
MRGTIFSLLTVAALGACAHTEDGKTATTIPVNSGSVKPGTAVQRGGKPVALAKGHLDVNKPLPAVALTDANWQPYTFKGDGTVKLVSIVPSIDTKVCEEQTHILGESQVLDPRVDRVTVSRDLPAAQKRFAAEAKLTNVHFYSDYKAGSFGQASGLLMVDSGLLARAVAVVDGKGEVRYLQVVPEVAQLPDMAKATQVANDLVKAAK